MKGAVLVAALLLAPQDPPDLARRAQAKIEQGDLQGAKQDLNAALKADPKCLPAVLLRATLHLRNDEYSSAVDDARKAVELAPKDPRALVLLGQGLEKMEKFKEANDWYSKAIDLDPEPPSHYVSRAGVRYSLGDHNGVLSDCDRALSRRPGYPDAIFHRASALMAAGRWADAIPVYEEYLKSPDASEWRGQANAMADALGSLAAKESKLTPSARLIGQAREELATRQKTRAVTLLEEVVRMDRRNVEARTLLILAYFNNGKASKEERSRMLGHLFAILDEEKKLTPELKRILRVSVSAVLAGLLWLDEHQSSDGRWSATTFGAACGCSGKGTVSDVRTTAWALLAHFGAGYSPLSKELYGAKPIAKSIDEGLAWLVSQQGLDGSFPGDVTDQAASALCLSEIFGMAELQAYKKPAQMGIDRLLALRIPGKGWPAQVGGLTPDARSTGWALQALKSAQLSELQVPKEPCEEAVDWLMANPGLPVQPLIAAGSVVLHRRKQHWDAVEEIVENAAKQPLEQAPDRQDAEATLFWTIGIRLAKNVEHWKQWAPPVRQLLVKLTRYDPKGEECSDGSTDPASAADRALGRPAMTALKVISLEIHYAYFNNLIGAPPAD